MTTIWTSSPEWRARATKHIRHLRDLGFSYEQIPDHMPDANDETLKPWEVYEFANPSKTAEQVAAWKARHDPHG
jgi:hypothetical protein